MYSFLAPFYPRFSCRKLRYEDEGGCAVALSDALETSYFNEPACRFIQLADGSRRFSDIFAAMRDEYEAEAAVLQTDLTELVRDMQWKRLLTLHKKPASP